MAGRAFPADKPLLDVAQAVPGYPPDAALTAHLGEIVGRPETARYTDIQGTRALRTALAGQTGAIYAAPVEPAQVCITAGCNQAFCLATMALAGAGDEVILPAPYYFNHQMWLDMLGVTAVHLPFNAERGGVPDAADAAALIGPKTRAIVLVTPNNPTGAGLSARRARRVLRFGAIARRRAGRRRDLPRFSDRRDTAARPCLGSTAGTRRWCISTASRRSTA